MNYTLFLQGPLDLFLKQVLFAVFKVQVHIPGLV